MFARDWYDSVTTLSSCTPSSSLPPYVSTFEQLLQFLSWWVPCEINTKIAHHSPTISLEHWVSSKFPQVNLILAIHPKCPQRWSYLIPGTWIPKSQKVTHKRFRSNMYHIRVTNDDEFAYFPDSFLSHHVHVALSLLILLYTIGNFTDYSTIHASQNVILYWQVV